MKYNNFGDLVFRGRRTDTLAWVSGYYLVLHARTEDLHFIVDEDGLYHRISPESVGMFTRQKDKNGIPVFSGDILSGHLDESYPENETRTVVAWHDSAWKTLECHGNHAFFDDIGSVSDWEVIGNELENPEFIKQAEEANSND